MHSKRDHHFIAILIQNMKFINATLIITYFISTLIYNCDIHDEIWNDKPARQILSITKKWAQWRNSNNFLFFGFKKKIQKIRGHCCVLFVILYLPSSFFERHARWNLNLSSKFTNRKQKKKRKKKKKSLKLNTYGQLMIMIIIVYMCKISTQRSFRDLLRDHDHEIQKIHKWNQGKITLFIHFSFTLDFSNFIFWNKLVRENVLQSEMTISILSIYQYIPILSIYN